MMISDQLFIDAMKNAAIGNLLTEMVEESDLDELVKEDMLAWIKKTENAYDCEHIPADDEFICGLLHRQRMEYALREASAEKDIYMPKPKKYEQ